MYDVQYYGLTTSRAKVDSREALALVLLLRMSMLRDDIWSEWWHLRHVTHKSTYCNPFPLVASANTRLSRCRALWSSLKTEVSYEYAGKWTVGVRVGHFNSSSASGLTRAKANLEEQGRSQKSGFYQHFFKKRACIQRDMQEPLDCRARPIFFLSRVSARV